MSGNNLQYKKSVCPLDCPDSCSLVATVRGGKVISLTGDRDHPITNGVICRKMKSYPQRLYGKNRILHPMKRVGKKGVSKFSQIDWDEAYAILTERIGDIVENYGGEAILPFVYAGNMGTINRFAGYPLFHKLGTSRLQETICSSAAKAGWRSHCGAVPGSPPEIAEDADVIIIWGSNTKVTNLHFWPYVARARKNGAKLVVVDPYRNATAASADIHLKVNPGGDSGLALAVLNVLLQKNGLDTSFITQSTTGFSTLKNYLEATPFAEFVESADISEQQIRELADLLCTTSKIFIRIGIGLTRNSRAGMTIRAITSLSAALGLFDGKPGRGVLLTTGAFSGDQNTLTWPSLAEKQTRKFNMVQLGNCLNTADPPIKMLFVYNANPLSVTPDSSLVRRALMQDDLFTVVHEQVMTPTARYADLLLPATTFLENRDMYTAYGHFYLSVVDAVIKPLAEAKSNFTFFQELGVKLGFTDPPFTQTLDERMADYLATLEGLPQSVKEKGITLGTAVCSTNAGIGKSRFPGGKKVYSFSQDTEPLLPLIACLAEGAEFDDADYPARYPFKLITPPHKNLLNSTFGERYEGDPGDVLIHPDDAAHHEVQDGALVTLFNGRGWARRRAKVSDATRQGLLVAEGIFWQSENHPAAINDLTSQNLTDMGGGGTYHESRVAIMKNE